VDARIDGGPLLLEDLDGPVTARVEGSEASLRRVVGDVRLEASGDLRVEDVEGAVHLENGNGSIEVRGVRGALAARSEGGGIRVASVAGPVTLTTRGGGISVERVRGDVRVSTERGRIELEDVEGRVELESQRGGIQVEELAGPVRARSERGAIEVEFVAEPSGVIETGRGSIHVEVPEGSGFALDAQTERGEIDLDGDFLVAQFEAGDERPPTPRLDDPGAAGRALAREVRDQVLDSVRRTLDGDPNDWDWDWRWGLDRDGRGWGAWGHWRSHGQEGRRDREGRWAQWRGRRGESVAGEVNGGGAPLRLHTRHGSIRIEGR
jgi:DUF4097 and DUF4098 domain-containing protein YvlB